MSDKPKFETFEDFWPFYVREHSNKTNRKLHFAGTTLALACVATAVVTRRPWIALAAPVFGYGGAWVGHFFVEKNRPASFKNPLWSFRADFKMYSLMWQGKMDAEVERAHARAADEAKTRDGEPARVDGAPEEAHAAN